MVINGTGAPGESRISMRRDLGEWGSAEGAGASTPARFLGLRHVPIRSNRTEGALGLMVPWLNPLRYPRHAVQSLTARMGGL